MSDYLIRVLSEKANVIGLACRTTDLVNLACRLHGTTPTASAALGRALTGGLLMGALGKPGLRVGLKFEGNGPLKKILVEADSEGTVRGFVGVPGIDVMVKDDGKLHVSGALGTEGFLTVFKDVGLDEPYQGIVKLRTGEIAEDIAYYFAESEQIPSATLVGISTSGGSPNVLEALSAAKAAGMVTVALTGRDGGAIGAAADIHVNVPSSSAARVQEVHRTILHVICELVEAGV